MGQTTKGLEFESTINDLESQIKEIAANKEPGHQERLRELRLELARTTKEVYSNLSAWQKVRVARHPDRPHTSDYLSLVFDEFVELHGDKLFGDDRAMLTGFAKVGEFKVMVAGHEKGRTLKERSECYFGCAHPEGYRKALTKMKMAEKYNIPIICLIDTPGAYPGIGAEERGQSLAIAENMFEMSRIKTPIICVVIGEGGSGGALGVGVGDRIAMLQHSYYSVISPEGCAGILWKSHKFAEQAASALRFTSDDLIQFGIVDDVIDEPLGGAHRNHHEMAGNLKRFLVSQLRDLTNKPIDELLNNRYDKFRKMGVFLEDAAS